MKGGNGYTRRRRRRSTCVCTHARALVRVCIENREACLGLCWWWWWHDTLPFPSLSLLVSLSYVLVGPPRMIGVASGGRQRWFRNTSDAAGPGIKTIQKLKLGESKYRVRRGDERHGMEFQFLPDCLFVSLYSFSLSLWRRNDAMEFNGTQK